MSAAWPRAYVRAWSADLQWTHEELELLAEDLLALARLNQGIVFGEPAPSEEERDRHAAARVTDALDALARSYVRYVQRDAELPRAALPSTDFTPELPLLDARRYGESVNVNTASADELAALPGLGAVTAARVVEYRRLNGSFGSLDELRKVAGISKDAIETLRTVAHAAPPSAGARITSASLDALQRNPTFKQYVQAIVAGDFALSRFRPRPDEDTKARVRREVHGLREEQEQRPYHPYRAMPATLASELARRAEQRQAAAGIHERRVAADRGAQPMHGTLLDDSEYPFFVEQLLKAAAARIRVIMFFMRFEDAKKYPTDALFAELLAAKQRGVDIKVILDRDAEGASIGSRVINDEAYKYLKKNGIAVTYDSVERYTHTKLVTVDGRHVVVGSHNWTAGSFYAYDDTSLYVRSTELCAHYDAQFDTLWAEYTA